MTGIPRVLCATALTCVLASTLFAIDPERDFSGNWILEPANNKPPVPLQPDPALTVTQEDAALRCSAPAPDGSTSRWSYLLDGTETRSRLGGDTRSSVAKWEGAALLIDTQVSGTADYTVMDRWKLSRDRSTLTINRQIVQRSGTTEEVLVYRREGQLSVRNAPAPPPAFATPESLEAALAGPSPAASPNLVVHAGTRIAMSLRNPVDTKHSHEGDHVYLQTIAPVAVNNRIVIPVGSYVNGTITQAKPAHGVNSKGQLFLRFDSLTLPNGVTRDFRSRLGSADSTTRGKVDSKEGKITGERDGSGDAPMIALGTGIGASVGGIAGAAAGHPLGGAGVGAAVGAAAGLASVLHSKRPDVVLPQGTTLEMILDRDLQFSPTELPF